MIFNLQPRFRNQQAKGAVFKDLITDWQQAVNLPVSLRQELNQQWPLNFSVQIFPSSDKKAIKALISLKDNLQIESVLLRHLDRRNTVCVSCQVGCPLQCRFCATAKIGFKRNLNSWEIINQVLFFSRLLKKENQKVTNIVFMGMGEPFLNYDNVISAIKILNEKDGLGLGARHISISTAGLPEGIRRLAQEKLQINLAVSIHAPFDKLRSQLMPVNQQYPLNQVLRSIDHYVKITRRRVMLEYLLIKDINDSAEMATKLAEIAKRRLCFVNLITYNRTGDYRPPETSCTQQFKAILEKAGLTVTQRYRFGEQTQAACGQLGLTFANLLKWKIEEKKGGEKK